ncbi:MAG: hypothetical protein R2749_22030 [Acidimicrobiales bacterium]
MTVTSSRPSSGRAAGQMRMPPPNIGVLATATSAARSRCSASAAPSRRSPPAVPPRCMTSSIGRRRGSSSTVATL